MTVSILTYHWEDNYGATLHAYATSKAIKCLGHTPEFIDLRLPYKPSLKSRIIFSLKRYRFNKFRHKYFKNRTKRTYWSVEDLRNNPPKSDCYLVGSDQTWNPQIGKELLPAFFLTFGESSIKRVTYATSIGLNQWEESPFISNKEISTALKNFDSILLREDSGLKIAKEIFNITAKQVIDPVLLFPCYPELTGEIRQSREIITYKLINDKNFYELGKELADILGLPIRSIGSVRKPSGFKTSYPESIEDWIKRIAGAEIVITDSFHGTVISLLYHRPFVIYVGDRNRITRILSLLAILDLEDRIVTESNDVEFIRLVALKEIDWEEVDKRLNSLRQKSLQLLSESLER